MTARYDWGVAQNALDFVQGQRQDFVCRDSSHSFIGEIGGFIQDMASAHGTSWANTYSTGGPQSR